MWNPVCWCCSRRAEHPGSTACADPDDGRHEDYMYVTDLLADVYNTYQRPSRPNLPQR
jgi:hypothetical protein